MKLIDLIKTFKFSDKEPCIFLIRHAEKNIAKSIRQDNIQLLTLGGKKDAAKLGKQLQLFYPQIHKSIVSSPVERCKETANSILRSFPNKPKINLLPSLNSNGVYVENVESIHKVFEKYQGEGTKIFAKILSGENMPGFRSKELGSSELLRNLISQLNKITSPALYITHDSILALFVGTLTKQIIDHSNWFGYLEGVCLKKSGNSVFLFWNGNKFDITKRCFELQQNFGKKPRPCL